MPNENTCIFCAGPITEGDVCSWCGFSQTSGQNLSGTLKYGTKVDCYVVGEVIAMDGESTSYFAYDTRQQKKIVLKEFLPVSMVAPRQGDNVVIQPGKEVLFKNLMMDFTDLYTTLSSIQSKSIAKVYKIFTANGTAYVALEYIRGDTLSQKLMKRGKPYTFKEARWLFQDLFLLLKELERHNIAHGGISDETVIITPDNYAVLSGFAIQDLRVKNEHIMYKLYDGFSAPEQYSPNQFPGFYSDVYSIAALFYYAVTGKKYKEGALDGKDSTRHIPRYARQALKYATMTAISQRIDNIEDFVLTLDNKATVEKPKESRVQKKKLDLSFLNKKYIPYMAVTVIFLLFLVAVLSLSGNGEPSSSYRTSSSTVPAKVFVPDLKGKSYSEILRDEELNLYFKFDVNEDYSNDYLPGQIISQQPTEGTEVKTGTTIYITVSKGEQLLTVPDGLAGDTLENVIRRLEYLGIRYAVTEVLQTEQFPYGTVAGTDKPRGTPLNPDTDTLIIYVSDDTPLPSPSPSPTPSPPPTPSPSPTPSPTPSPSEEPGSSSEASSGSEAIQ